MNGVTQQQWHSCWDNWESSWEGGWGSRTKQKGKWVINIWKTKLLEFLFVSTLSERHSKLNRIPRLMKCRIILDRFVRMQCHLHLMPPLLIKGSRKNILMGEGRGTLVENMSLIDIITGKKRSHMTEAWSGWPVKSSSSKTCWVTGERRWFKTMAGNVCFIQGYQFMHHM